MSWTITKYKRWTANRKAAVVEALLKGKSFERSESRNWHDEALRQALYQFRDRYNTHWIMQRHAYRTPQQGHNDWNQK